MACSVKRSYFPIPLCWSSLFVYIYNFLNNGFAIQGSHPLAGVCVEALFICNVVLKKTNKQTNTSIHFSLVKEDSTEMGKLIHQGRLNVIFHFRSKPLRKYCKWPDYLEMQSTLLSVIPIEVEHH